MAKINVLHLSHHFSPFPGGIENFALELCRQLNTRKHSSQVICLNRNPSSQRRLPPAETVEGIKVQRIPFIDFKYYKFAPSVLKKVLTSKADLIHVHGLGFFSDFLLLTKWLHRKPVVVSTHGAIFHTKRLDLLKKIYFNFFQKFILNQADRVIAVSKNDFKLFSLIIKHQKLCLVENAINLDRFSLPKNSSRKKNSFLFFGRLSKNKRVDRLIECFAELKKLSKKKERKPRLVVVGQDFEGLKPSLERMAEQKGLKQEISFLGELEDKDLLKELGQAEFFVSASEFEGFGLSAIEAASAGLIPVLNRIETFKAFNEDGLSCCLVDFGKRSDAAKKINALLQLNEKEKKMRSLSAQRFSQKFSWRQRIIDFEKIYEEVLA